MATKLKGMPREAGKNLTNLRAEGLVPAVVYGAGQATVSLSVSLKDFIKVYKETGESGTVSLELPTGTLTVLVHEVTDDPVKSIPQHIDFLAIDVNKPVEVSVPLEFIGVAPAVKGGLGTLVKVIHEIELRGLPKNIPHSVEVDISSLEALESQITVEQISLPSGVEATAKPTDIVVLIAAVKEETEEAPTAIDFSAIEVEKKGKKEEEASTEA